MICKECHSQGLKSTVREDAWSGMTTLLYCSPYYDEDGHYHHHNANTTTLNFICSNNHRWSEKRYNKCVSCDWTNEPKETQCE